MAEVPLGLNAQLHTPPLPATHVSAGTSLDTGSKFSLYLSFIWLSLLRWSDLVSHSHDIGSSRSGSAGVGREAIGERDDEVAQFVGALDDERPVE
jgi:hypothetical protein